MQTDPGDDRPAGVGVDGCRGGWVWIAAGRRPAAGRARFLAEVVERFSTERILVDIPIGLPSGKNPRRCEATARRLAGPRRASVFTPPSRVVLAAPDYASANAANRRETGKGLSKQAWHLVPRIREADELLREDPRLADRLLESHPEVCFRLLAGVPLANYKKTAGGRAERLAALAAVSPRLHRALPGFERALRGHAAPDDLVDAAVLAVVAARPVGELAVLPSEPQWDITGLPMQMVVPWLQGDDEDAPGGMRRLT